MAILSILEYPDPRLRTEAALVETVDTAIRQYIDNLFDTMYQEKGVGLAATQVNIHKRIIVMDCSEEQDSPICIINPEIIHQEGNQVEFEGCLSLPGVFDKVSRSKKLIARGLDKDGKPMELTAEGLLAVCIAHEIEHLNGKLFIDHLSNLKKDRLLRKMQKQRTREQEA